MKPIFSLLSVLVFLVSCHSSVKQEKQPEWQPPMIQTEMVKAFSDKCRKENLPPDSVLLRDPI